MVTHTHTYVHMQVCVHSSHGTCRKTDSNKYGHVNRQTDKQTCYLGNPVHCSKLRVKVSAVWELFHHHGNQVMQQRLFLDVVLHIHQLWQETEVEGLHLRREGRGGEGRRESRKEMYVIQVNN